MQIWRIRKRYKKIKNRKYKKRKRNTKIKRRYSKNYRKSSNDSSTNYPWSDEFVERWKKLVENTIMDSFDNIFYKNILLVRVINITVRIVYDIADEKIKEKIKDIIPLENTIKQTRNIENLHLLIKKNGRDFNLSEEELKLAEIL